MNPPETARAVVLTLQRLGTATELAKVRKRLEPDEPAIGNRMKDVFDVAKSATAIPVPQWVLLVAEPTYEARMAAFSILDFKARKNLGSQDLLGLYLDHHHRISSWDMVDRAAPRVVGAALAGGPYDVLHELAASPDPLRRRTAMTAPLWFTRSCELADLAVGFEIAETLCADPDPTVHKAVGIFLAYAGELEPVRHTRFLNDHGPSMPAAARRLAVRKQ